MSKLPRRNTLLRTLNQLAFKILSLTTDKDQPGSYASLSHGGDQQGIVKGAFHTLIKDVGVLSFFPS
jgi:hypothetical protein